MSQPSDNTYSAAWSDLIAALTLLARAGNPVSPFHCEHDTLHIMADPADFTPEELAQLEAWSIHADEENGSFYSHYYGSA